MSCIADCFIDILNSLKINVVPKYNRAPAANAVDDLKC